METPPRSCLRVLRRAVSLALPALLWVGTSTLAAAQQHAHTHGRLALSAAIDAQSITIGMEAPLDNFLGFERAPRTDGERRQVADMVSRLDAADKLFIPDPKAECTLAKVELVSDVLGLGTKATIGAALSRDSRKGPDAHADIDITIRFACAKADTARQIEVRLFEVFKRLRSIDAQVASGQGQFRRSLTPTDTKLTWGR